MTTRVLVCSADRDLGSLLGEIVVQRDGFEVVALASTGREAVVLSRLLAPDIVLLDTALPDYSAGQVCLWLNEDSPRSRVLALSLHTEPRFVSGMLRVGAVGYLVTSSALEELPSAIDSVCAGKPYLCKAVVDIAVERGLRVDP